MTITKITVRTTHNPSHTKHTVTWFVRLSDGGVWGKKVVLSNAAEAKDVADKLKETAKLIK